jgi:putative membrane protein
MGSLQFTLYKIFVNAIGLGVSAFIFKHVKIDSFWALLVAGLVLSVMNVFVKPFLVLITLPFHVLTLGFFYFIVNAIIILIVSSLVEGFSVDGLWTAVGVSIVVSIVNLFFDIFYGKPKINIKIERY